MVSVSLGSKAKNYEFNVTDIDLDMIDTKPKKVSIASGSLTLYSADDDYVTLYGDFAPSKIGKPDQGIKHLDAISVVENGKLSYTASNLGMTGDDFVSESIFKAYLAEQTYSIKGNGYANHLVAAGQKDVIRGLDGNDSLFGMAGNDKIFGDSGADRLDGGLGNDVLTGGSGVDVFVFADASGLDAITDFDAKGNVHDIIDLSGHATINGFGDLSIEQSGAHVAVDLGGGNVITLRNVSSALLDAGDFLF